MYTHSSAFLTFLHCQGGWKCLEECHAHTLSLLGFLWFCMYSLLQHILCFVLPRANMFHLRGGSLLADVLHCSRTFPSP